MSVRTGCWRPRPQRLEEVAEGVFAHIQPDGSWMINNTGFLVGPDGVTSIDTCSTELRTRSYLDAVAQVTPLPVRTLLNTHHHPDHTAGNGLFTGATIVAHDNAREEMRARAAAQLRDLDRRRLRRPRARPALPHLPREVDAVGRRPALRAAVRRGTGAHRFELDRNP